MYAITRDDDARRAREYWEQRAQLASDGLLAVLPGATPRSRELRDATRRMLQSWTLGRIRAVKPRFGCCVDLGCGDGDWTAQLASIADEIHGCDVAAPFVERARRRLPGAHIECCDVRDYRIPAGADLVYVGAVFMYLDDVDVLDVLSRIRARAAAGAVIVWRDFCAFNFGRRSVNRSEDRFSVHRAPSDLRALAECAGLAVHELRSSTSIYGEVLGGRALQWPARTLLRAATIAWKRASYTAVLRVR